MLANIPYMDPTGHASTPLLGPTDGSLEVFSMIWTLARCRMNFGPLPRTMSSCALAGKWTAVVLSNQSDSYGYLV